MKYSSEGILVLRDVQIKRTTLTFEEQQSKIPDLRNKDNTITAELQKFTLTLDNYEKDIDRIGDTTQDLNNRYKQIEDDILREEALADNAKINLLNVQQERNKLQQQGDLFPEKSSSLNKTNDDL